MPFNMIYFCLFACNRTRIGTTQNSAADSVDLADFSIQLIPFLSLESNEYPWTIYINLLCFVSVIDLASVAKPMSRRTMWISLSSHVNWFRFCYNAGPSPLRRRWMAIDQVRKWKKNALLKYMTSWHMKFKISVSNYF